MEDVESTLAEPSLLGSPKLLSTVELISQLEKQVPLEMKALLKNLESSQQEDRLDQSSLKDSAQKLLSLAKASLLIQLLPSLLGMKSSFQPEELFQELHHLVEKLQTLYRDQALKAIDSKAERVLQKIQAKEKIIREQIAHKQKTISQLVTEKTKRIEGR